MYKVKIIGDRPDFRVFIDLLYGIDRNVDTEGNSNPVNSRKWTDLYIKDRESEDPYVEIVISEDDESFFEVDSKSEYLEELASLYLLEYCGSEIKKGDYQLSKNDIDDLNNKYLKQLNRARESVWHSSNDENPYPNFP